MDESDAAESDVGWSLGQELANFVYLATGPLLGGSGDRGFQLALTGCDLWEQSRFITAVNWVSS